MARTSKPLTDLAVKRAKGPRTIGDSRGLYLQVGKSGSKSWLFRYMQHRKEHWMGLGGFPDVSLAEAREKALACRKLLREGTDPIQHRRAGLATAQLEAARAVTFKECALAYIEAHRPGWKNVKHAQQWANTFESYVFPTFGSVSVQDIDITLVLKVLEPIWPTKTETATRIRQRIESVLDWATARGYRVGENPARWRGYLDKVLPKRSKMQRVRHHAAMPYSDLPEFFADLGKRNTISAMALCFTILTAARSGEIRGAIWPEVDLDTRIWSIPPERTKSHRLHRVPLSDEAIGVLREALASRVDNGSGLIFPGERPGKPMSENTMRKYLQEEMRREGLTVHGFRSSFRDWAGERTNFPREVAEMALAHVTSDKTEAAYARSDLLDRRRRLMDAWASYCTSGPGEGAVVPIREAG